MNGLFYATNSFLPILIFPQTTGPRFERGFPSILSFALVAIVLMRKFFSKPGLFVLSFIHRTVITLTPPYQ